MLVLVEDAAEAVASGLIGITGPEPEGRLLVTTLRSGSPE
jgi:hypothetical protein